MLAVLPTTEARIESQFSNAVRFLPGSRTPMNIRIESLLAGAERAVGAVVIIDVFRAFTTAAVALARGATKIVVVRDVDEALALRAAGVGQLCMGEVGGKRPSGFDLGNSPFEASQADLEGRT